MVSSHKSQWITTSEPWVLCRWKANVAIIQCFTELSFETARAQLPGCISIFSISYSLYPCWSHQLLEVTYDCCLLWVCDWFTKSIWSTELWNLIVFMNYFWQIRISNYFQLSRNKFLSWHWETGNGNRWISHHISAKPC